MKVHYFIFGKISALLSSESQAYSMLKSPTHEGFEKIEADTLQRILANRL